MNTIINNPYVGPRMFLKEEAHLFFGREREARDLISLVVSSQLVLFYAQSGAGKSSLINTRLIPRLEEKGYEVLRVGRLSGDVPSGGEVNNIYIFNLIHSLIPQEIDLDLLKKMSLAEFLTRLNIDDGTIGAAAKKGGHLSRRRILIIDQFEEFFSTHPEAWEKREDFFLQLAQAMESDPHLWVILVMREDYIAALDPYAHHVPGGLRVRYYMQRLGYEAALKAVKRPVETLRPFGEGVAEKLVDDLSSVKVQRADGTFDIQPGQYVEPVQLQVVCYNLWENLHPDGTEITERDLQKVGDVDQSLERHYARRVREVAQSKKVGERSIREWFEKKLITPSGMRNIVMQDVNKRAGELNDDVIQALQSDLVRAEKRGATIFYELTHDRFVEPIIANNKSWIRQHFSRLLHQGARLWEERGRSEGVLLRGKELREEEVWAKANVDQLSLIEKEYLNAGLKAQAQQDRERIRNWGLVLLTICALTLMCAALGFGYWALRERSKAQASDQKAQNELLRSESIRLALQSKMLLVNEVNSNAELVTLLSIRSLNGMYIPEADASLVESMDRLYAVHTFEGHQDGIRSIAVSPNGKYLATGSKDNTAKLWETETGELVRTLEGHANWVNSVTFSPDGRYILTGSYDNTAKIWDVSSGNVLSTLSRQNGAILAVAYSPDGNFVLTGSDDNTAKLWDASTGKEVRTFAGHEGVVRDVAFSASGDYVLTGSDDATAKLWDLTTGEEIYTFKGYARAIYSVAFSPDDKRIVVGGRGEAHAVVWDIESRERVLILAGHRSTVHDVAFSNNGYFILTGSFDNTAILWSSKTGEKVRTFSGHSNPIYGVAFSPDDQYIFTGSTDATAKMWLTSEVRVPRLFTADDEIYNVVFSPDGKSILTGGNNSYPTIWDTLTGKGIRTFVGHTDFVHAVSISPNGKYTLTGSYDGTARLWDTETGKEIRTYGGHSDSVWSVAIAPNAAYILTGSADATAKLWDLNSGKEIRVFEGHNSGINSVAFSPDGRYILTGSDDQTAKLWDMEMGTVIFTVEHSQAIWSVAFSPDGRYILTGSIDGTARLWNAETGGEVRAFEGHTDRVFGVAFSSDGKYILTGSADNTAKLWEAGTGREIRTLIGHTDRVYSVAFSPDDQYVVTGSADGTARLWDFDYRTTMGLACSVLTRDLTNEERQRYAILGDSLTCSPQQPQVLPPPSVFTATPAEIESLLYTGKIEEMEILYSLEKIQEWNSDDVEELDADSWNQLCWWGSLVGYAIEVKDYCEKAVLLAPEDGNIRDSRGLNRALLGDYEGAIEDFEYAIQWFNENGVIRSITAKRETWIEALENDRNPFDSATLEELKNEEVEYELVEP